MDDSRRSLHPSLGSSKPTERQHLPSSPGTCQLPRSQEQFQLAALLRSAWFLPALIMPWGCLSSSDLTCGTLLGPTTEVLALRVSPILPARCLPSREAIR